MSDIGTFGQELTWNLGEPSTYQHPMKTQDLLFHSATSSTLLAPHDDEQLAGVAGNKDISKLETLPRKTPAVHMPPKLSVTEMEEEVYTLFLCM